MGSVFFIEAFSVIIQVFSFKTRGKRIFLMTPLHHHFELKGIPEPKVTIRFWILGIIFALYTCNAKNKMISNRTEPKADEYKR